ncbi:DUF4167 domain-containing protein [Microvirga pudoricolor]|uniref:DUF4167 domain-containing protein n=1 Tax=Microvirga pudoricolor TaxID=2778729 RepID=UPI00194FDE65|nr:DUF4167 domain-containing protein [Microvirga pudoricolor]MBM6593408.1 DUF4167 domain-containing protein [Microvirga pudoricolor]
MRGRNNNRGNNKGPNPLTRSYESNGPDVKIRGTAQHIAEKYSQLARDATASGDPVAAENYFQHAEHYFRIIATAQEQLREQYGYQQRFDDEGDEEGFPGGDRQDFGNGDEVDPGQQPQPFEQRSEGERQPRFDRNERFNRDRQDRPERGDRQDRGERRERFNNRDRAPRQDYQRQDQPRAEFGSDDQPRQDRPARFDRQERGERQERSERPDRGERQDRVERQERGERSEFRRDRRPRHEDESAETGSLPAFLTNPVRQPIPVESEPAPAEAQFKGFESAEGPAPVKTRRPRRTRREMEEARAAEAAAKGIETPAAE